MDIKTIKNNIKSLTDDDLLNLLNEVSEEMKRRNELISPKITDFKNKSIEENVITVLSAISSLSNTETYEALKNFGNTKKSK